MKTGTIVLIPFPFAELTNVKVRPAIVVSSTKDKYQDLILCAISSVVPAKMSAFEISIQPDTVNKLRVPSIIKVDRIVTLKKEDVITVLGTLSTMRLLISRGNSSNLWIDDVLCSRSGLKNLTQHPSYPLHFTSI